jgi:hypothetical protein
LTHETALEIIDSCRKNPEQFVELKRHHERQVVTPKETLRYFTPSTIPYSPESQIAFQIKIDSMTSPIKIPGQEAYLLIKKTTHIPPKQLSFGDSHAEIRKNLMAVKFPVFRGQWVEELRGRFEVVVDEEAIEKYLTFN